MSWRSRQVDSDCNLHLCCEYHYCSYSQYLDEKYSWWYNWNNYWSWYSSFLVVVHSVVLDYCKAFGGAKDWATLMVIRLVKTWNLFLEFENFTILKNQIFKFFRVIIKKFNIKFEILKKHNVFTNASKEEEINKQGYALFTMVIFCRVSISKENTLAFRKVGIDI